MGLVGYIILLGYIESTGSLSYSCLVPSVINPTSILILSRTVSVEFDIVGAGGIVGGVVGNRVEKSE